MRPHPHAGPRRWLFAIALAVAVFLHVALNRFLRFSGALLDAADEFISLSFRKLEDVICQVGPFLLELALQDIPVAFGFCRSHNILGLVF